MERNPFEHIRPLPPDAVTGRDDLLDHFAVRLERSMAALTGPARKLIQRLINSSELGVSLAPGIGFKATFGRKDGPDPVAVLHGMLDLLTTAAKRRSGLLLVMDEFQDVARVADLDAILRSHLQAAPDVAVIFAGSRPSMMKTLFGDRRRPFYSQADIIEIGQLDSATAAQVVSERFAATGLDAGDAAELHCRQRRWAPAATDAVGTPVVGSCGSGWGRIGGGSWRGHRTGTEASPSTNTVRALVRWTGPIAMPCGQ